MQTKGTVVEQLHGKSIEEGHLGGWAYLGDSATYYPMMWDYLISKYNIKSVIDVGCGRGFSSLYFKSLGCSVLGVDGSQQAKDSSLISDHFHHHDYSKGKSGITGEIDFAWSCEFVEHIDEQYMQNFVDDFKKAKYLAITFAGIGQGGHHHVNENTQEYWIDVMNKNGFVFDETETNTLREMSLQDPVMQEMMGKISSQVCFSIVPHFAQRGLFFVNTARS